MKVHPNFEALNLLEWLLVVVNWSLLSAPGDSSAIPPAGAAGGDPKCQHSSGGRAALLQIGGTPGSVHTAGGTALVPAQAASVVAQYQRATKVVWRERQQKKESHNYRTVILHCRHFNSAFCHTHKCHFYICCKLCVHTTLLNSAPVIFWHPLGVEVSKITLNFGKGIPKSRL